MPADYPSPVKNLIVELKKLPGIGARSAERIAIWLLQNPKAAPQELATALLTSQQEITSCPTCGFFATHDHCALCDGERDDTTLCIVEQATDILPIERTGSYKGRYHCLGGKLSPLDHVTPDDLRIQPLLERISLHQEIILALSSDVEGEATANYLASLLRPHHIRITRIAQGLPAGGGLEHADELTLIRAMQGRRDF